MTDLGQTGLEQMAPEQTNLRQMNRAAREYYDTLPPLIQEQVLKNGAGLSNKRDMQNFYRGILRSGPETVKPDILL